MPHWSGYQSLATAAARGRRTWRRIARAEPAAAARAALPILLAALSTPAAAQTGASLTAASDFQLRGVSYSRGRPAATLSVAGDARSGLFADASLTAAILPRGRIRFTGVSGNLGIARRLGPDLSADVGVTRLQFVDAALDGRGAGYTEVYAGLRRSAVTVRLHYSPDYFGVGNKTLYADGAVGFRPADDWSVTLHAGALTYLGTDSYPIRYDAQIAARRRIGRWQAQLAAGVGGPGRAYYTRTVHRNALVASASLAF